MGSVSIFSVRGKGRMAVDELTCSRTTSCALDLAARNFAISRCLAVCLGTKVAIRQKNEPAAV